MAILEFIKHEPMTYNDKSEDSYFGFVLSTSRKALASFPQIFYSSGEPWGEANRYAYFRFYDSQKKLKTINNEMTHLARYADWLERVNLNWLHFPKRKAERCLFRYRGYLIDQRDLGLLAPSTATQAMNSIVAFYRWASVQGYTSERSALFDSKVKVISYFDSVGFARTIRTTSTDLAIPNRARTGIRLEDGLTPINQASTKTLVSYLSFQSNRELFLIVKTALHTGCRHETVTTLNINALEKAYPDPELTNVYKIKVGPGTGVNTKFDVSGEIYMPKQLLEELIEYFYSAEAILRRSKADKSRTNLIFLTCRGNKYTTQTFGTLMHRLKTALINEGHTEFGRFKFHQLRATFGTMLMRTILETPGMTSLNALEFVKNALLHKDASTTWKYIRFIENEPIEKKFLDTLWSIFTGSTDESKKLIEDLTGSKQIDRA